ncbi:cilia- and flagella-associated protein 65 isoform X5 [Osmia lignaria lignaria]|uniref:cilia- and flagella-associated protein 65 isoform X5 n=1 Tax=Osmia lignaria lignaria TaxID=1437193 RepID=UPI00402B36FD
MKVIELNYGDVEVGKTAVKTIEIWNESCKEQIYQAQRDPTANPLDHVFHLRSYNWALAAEEKFVCEIRYRPFVVSPKNVDYFMITDTSGSCTKIIVQGSCIGPEVVCSMTKMFMGCTQKCTEVKRRIKLINKSKVAAIFMIDIDEKYQVFRTSLNCGTIASSSYKYVTITFSPPENGRYTYHLAILILHQEPIIIELHGSSIATDYKEDDMTCLSYSWKETNPFEGYMRDTVNILGELPAVSLSKHYFNFGQADVDPDNIIQRIPHAICFTNHNQSNLLVRWEKDIDGIFTITPYKMHVRANQSALFEVTFNPNARNNLYGRELIASAFFEQQQDVYFPIIISVRVIGHSFPISSNGWIPQYEIPQTVIMPPCVPPIPVYTSFLIKKFGHLPMMFQFVSPPASHFVVKPMLGVIHHNYQIIVVEMIPENKNEQIYIERWTVYFNGNTKNESYIDLKGYAEYANIMFCNNNVLIFPAVMPHCQQFVQLGMRNVTRHKIRYRFYQLPSEFKIQDETGEIEPNDTLFQECSFSPIEPNIDYDFEAQCVLLVIKNDTIVGTKCCVTLRVRGRCEMGFLEAIPNELNFNEMEYNTTKTLFFDLVNFSTVNIYYTLICTHTSWPIGDIKKDVEISPASETAFSGTRKKVTVTITPRTPGFYEFAVEYLLRINYRTDKIVSSEKARRICMVNCMCTLPSVKVTIPVTMGDKTSELILKGKASHYFKSTDFGRTIPPHCACKTELFPAYFNIDCIDMWAVPMYNHVIKMLLVYNNLDYAALAYEWKCQYVPDIISVDVFPQKGIIRPNAVQSFRVKIRTKGQSGRIDLNVPCEFLNASERGEYQRSVIRYDILCKELEGQFKITEKGTSVPEPWIKILKKPEPYCKVLTLRCTIVPIEDEHLRMSLMEELKATPSSTIYFDDRKNYNITKDENELSMVAFILEGILWDIINSERFQKMMEESLIPGRNLYYSQLVMDLAERKRLIRRSYISPPLTLTNSIFEKMLFSTVHDEFSLKTSHLVPNEDIRHKNYIKMLPKEKRIDLEQEKQDLYENAVDDEYDDEFDTIRTRVRVSFID